MQEALSILNRRVASIYTLLIYGIDMLTFSLDRKTLSLWLSSHV